MAEKKMKVALISAGMITNAAHIPAYLNMKDDVEIVAVADLNKDAARATADRWDIPHAFGDAEEMLKAMEPDLVSVCTPNIAHKAMSIMALEHGANVICEKPVAIRYKDALEMYGTAERVGKKLIACQTMRYYPEHMVAKDIVKSGSLGDIYFGEMNRIRRRGVPTWGNFHRKDINGGGALCDIGVHIIDAMMWIMGVTKVTSVSGSSTSVITRSGEQVVRSLVEAGAPSGVFGNGCSYKPEEFENEEFGAGTIRFDGGMVNFKVGWAANLPNMTSMTIVGDKAGLQVPELNMITTHSGYQADVKARWFNEGPYKDKTFNGHWYMIENVVNALRGREDFMVKPEETINVASIIDAFYRSAELGREVRIDELL